MSERIIIFDTTLRDGEQSPGFSMNLAEKLELARQLARLGVDVIEAGFPISSPGDFESVKTVAQQVEGPEICGLARAMPKDIDRCWEAVKYSARPRIHTFIATSPVHVEQKLKKEYAAVKQIAIDAVKRAKEHTDSVEFSTEDAARTERDYICEVVEAAIEAGATTINLPDTVGYSNPWEYGEMVAHVIANVPNSDRAVISVHCHNDLGLAVANSLAAVRAGARQVECTINGIGERAGNASLEEFVMNVATRRDCFDFETGVRTELIYPLSRMLSRFTGVECQPNKAIVGANAFAHEAGIHQDGVLKERTTYEIMSPKSVGWTGENLVLGKHSGRHAFKTRLEALGLALVDEQFEQAFEGFKVLADKKKTIYDEDLFVLCDAHDGNGKDRFALDEMIITTDGREPKARIVLEKDGQLSAAEGTGDGPLDAAFSVVKQLTGTEDSVLTDYNVSALSRGTDAQGNARVAIRLGNRSASGRGTDTDVIKASVIAFVDAVNRLQAMADREEELRANEP